VDLVPIGAYHGRVRENISHLFKYKCMNLQGKRVGVYGAYLMACYDPNKEVFQSVCKIGTGFSDSMLQSLTTAMSSLVIDYRPSTYVYGEMLEPDVFFDAKTVWEVKAADLSLSSSACRHELSCAHLTQRTRSSQRCLGNG
jgi:DNA ligase-1